MISLSSNDSISNSAKSLQKTSDCKKKGGCVPPAPSLNPSLYKIDNLRKLIN